MKRFVLLLILGPIASTLVASDTIGKFDDDVVSFMKEKIIESEKHLKTYHFAVDEMSEKPIASYDEYYGEANFKKLPAGIKEMIRQIKLYKKFLGEGFPDVENVNAKLKSYLALKSKTENDAKKDKELLTRKRDLGKLPWAKCENDIKSIDEKSYRKLRDAYWKLVEKWFKKYGI